MSRVAVRGSLLSLPLLALACGATSSGENGAVGDGGGSAADATTDGGAGPDGSTSGDAAPGVDGGSDADASGCPGVPCAGAGEACVTGQCVLDCRVPGANPCPTGTVCDVSDANPGKCVDPSTACVTTSTPEPCGNLVCGPGAACDGAGQCYPRVPCKAVTCDPSGCYGASCACTRASGCAPAPVGTSGTAGTLNDPTFAHGLVDLRFDPSCTAWGVTLISGPDYLRSLAPDGGIASVAGVTNLNMGEVAVLESDTSATEIDVSLTYICCSTCGCQLSSTPQGAAHYDAATKQIPMVIPSMAFTDGTGPFGNAVIDTGPEGLAYGFGTVIYLGNVNVNGDYYSLDLTTKTEKLVTTFPSRVYSSAPFDLDTMLVALEGGAMVLYRLTDGKTTAWATSSSPVTSLTRDFFDGSVYVARVDRAIWRYDAQGQGAAFRTAANPARLAIAPDGWLYSLEIPAPFADVTPTVERWQLPTTR